MINLYRRNGFYRLANGFTATEISRVRQAFTELIATPLPGVGMIYEDEGGSVVRSIMGWQRAAGVLSEFARADLVLRPVQKILGGAVEFHQTKYNPKAGNEDGKKWDPHRGDTFWCWKDGVPDPNKMLSVFIALTDQTEQNGAVWVWKGSHVITLDQIRPFMIGLDQNGQLSQDTAADLSLQISSEKLAAIDQDFERVPLIGPVGTVWILNAGLLHASAANKSAENRDLVANVFRLVGNTPRHPRPEHYLSEPPGNF